MIPKIPSPAKVAKARHTGYSGLCYNTSHIVVPTDGKKRTRRTMQRRPRDRQRKLWVIAASFSGSSKSHSPAPFTGSNVLLIIEYFLLRHHNAHKNQSILLISAIRVRSLFESGHRVTIRSYHQGFRKLIHYIY